MSKFGNTTVVARASLMLGASLSALIATTPALAQATSDTATEETVPPESTPAEADAQLEAQSVADSPAVEPAQDDAIVVTGSRIRRTEASSESPLLIIDPVVAQRQGRLDTAEIVQNSPISSGSSQVTAGISTSGQAVNGGPGAQTISLRGLGASRTLTLLNGRRAGPAGTRGAVVAFDLNVLPSSIIKSVEVLKDGASSVYGSDAIAGVVNLLTKKDTNGIEATGFVSVPQKGGAETYNVSAAWGKDFGRGHIMIAGDYYHRNELERQDRSYLGCPRTNYRHPDGSSADLIDPRTGEFACDQGTQWGHVWAYYASNMPGDVEDATAMPGGVTLIQYSYGNDNLGAYLPPIGPASNPFDVIAPPGWYAVNWRCEREVTPTAECLTQMRNASALTNGYHPYEQKSSVTPETTRYTLFADGSFKLNDGIELYAEGLFNRRRNYHDFYGQIYNFGYTGYFADDDPENPFPGWNPGSFDGSEPFAFLSPTGIIDQKDQKITVDYYRGVVGARGDITSNWSYDIFGQYSRSKGDYSLQQILQESIDQQSARGFGAPCAGEFTEFTNRACVQMPWTDPRVMAGQLTQEEIDYLTEWETGRTKYVQKFVEASITGTPFSLPAGDVGIALGATARRDKINDTPGHLTLFENPDWDPATDPPEEQYIDIVFDNNFSSQITAGHQDTNEAFTEIRVPILRDSPIAKELTISGAARVTNVKAVRRDGESDSSKGNWTYKLLGNWQVNDWLRLRSTYGTSFRAPGLFEQFLAGQVTDERQIDIDPCVNWEAAFEDGTISERVRDNCEADGIPPTHGGGGIQAEVFTSGGLGVLDPEKSRSFTASLILTPRFSFLPDTDLALTIDYFNIKVKDEIAFLTPEEILLGCYESDNFPNDPRCDLFERGQDGNPLNIRSVTSRYINIDEQTNRGLDFTLRIRHNLGRLGRLSFLAQATKQLEDKQMRLGEVDDLNGDIGDPKFTADLSTTWEIGSTSLFWGMNVIGKSSSEADFIELNGDLCNLTETGERLYGDYCVNARTPTYVYHNVSVTQRVGEKFEMTLGVSNLFDKDPPHVSGFLTIGNVPFVSQYDWVGRRFFMQAKARF